MELASNAKISNKRSLNVVQKALLPTVTAYPSIFQLTDLRGGATSIPRWIAVHLNNNGNYGFLQLISNVYGLLNRYFPKAKLWTDQQHTFNSEWTFSWKIEIHLTNSCLTVNSRVYYLR